MNKKTIVNKIYKLERELESLKNQVEKYKDNDFEYGCNYYINSSMEVEGYGYEDVENRFSKTEEFNCFKDELTAKKWAKKINALHKLRIIAEHLNKGWEPNWENENEIKFSIYRDKFETGVEYTRISNPYFICFKTKELAEKAIEMMGEQSLKDYFA